MRVYVARDEEVDRHRCAGKPEYGEGYRGDDQDKEEERVHHSTADEQGKARAAGVPCRWSPDQVVMH